MKIVTTSSGLTLLELMVVLVILAILAGGSTMMFTNGAARVRSAIFRIQGDFNLARSEAVDRYRDVLIDFTPGAVDGYQLCLDSDADRDCGDEPPENIIKEVQLDEDVQLYDCTSAPPFPTGGPTKTSSGTPLAGKNGLVFGGPNYIYMQPDGTSSDNGSIIVYAPDPGDPLSIRGAPHAAVISSASTGRIRVMRWREESSKWSRK